MKEYNVSNQEVGLFFVINFGLTILMGIAMGFAYNKGFVDSFPLVQMYYPAMSVIIVLFLKRKREKELPNKFFKTYLFFAITSIAYLLISVFILNKNPNSHLNIWLAIGSVFIIIAYIDDSHEAIVNFGLEFRKNEKQSINSILLFVGLYLAAIFIASLLTGEIKEFVLPFKSIETWIKLLTLPFLFIINCIAFFGEEFGWRYFLQPALQERMGKIKGVLVLGATWGIWHLPINMFYYSPETSFYSVVNHLIVCIAYSVFLGYVYMKTNNIWTVSIIHFINNSMGILIYNATPNNNILTWQSVLFNLFVFSIVYMPFLLTKEYRKSITIEKVL